MDCECQIEVSMEYEDQTESMWMSVDDIAEDMHCSESREQVEETPESWRCFREKKNEGQ